MALSMALTVVLAAAIRQGLRAAARAHKTRRFHLIQPVFSVQRLGYTSGGSRGCRTLPSPPGSRESCTRRRAGTMVARARTPAPASRAALPVWNESVNLLGERLVPRCDLPVVAEGLVLPVFRSVRLAALIVKVLLVRWRDADKRIIPQVVGTAAGLDLRQEADDVLCPLDRIEFGPVGVIGAHVDKWDM